MASDWYQEEIFNAPNGREYSYQVFDEDTRQWKYIMQPLISTYEEALSECAYFRDSYDIRIVKICRYLPLHQKWPLVQSVVRVLKKVS